MNLRLFRTSGRPSIRAAARTLTALAAALWLSGCVVETRRVGRPEPPCGGATWVEGHYGPHGAWHPGHWRCPRTVEVIEVD